MTRLLDADILIDIGRGYLPAIQWYTGIAGAVGVPGFVVMELLAGCSNKADLIRIQTQVAPLPIV